VTTLAPALPGDLRRLPAGDPEHYTHALCSVAQVGMMGSGKSTVGKMLANTLKYAFFDTDSVIELAHDKKPVSQIFSEQGQDYFRQCESQVRCRWQARGRMRGREDRVGRLGRRLTESLRAFRRLPEVPSTKCLTPCVCLACCLVHVRAQQIIKELSPYRNLVISTGGGAVLKPENWYAPRLAMLDHSYSSHAPASSL
jgi:hypothetical protein